MYSAQKNNRSLKTAVIFASALTGYTKGNIERHLSDIKLP